MFLTPRRWLPFHPREGSSAGFVLTGGASWDNFKLPGIGVPLQTSGHAIDDRTQPAAMNISPLEFTGERYVPTEPGEIRLEHLHRYAWSRHLVVDKDVLDLASGEGYGSQMLAEAGARSVIGVDLSVEAVTHAQHVYGSVPGLRFVHGDAAAVPLPDRSVDVVVSFETLEHHDRHEEMLSEIRRVLRPHGVLVISSPNRPIYDAQNQQRNEFHVKELDLGEFKALLGHHFQHVRIFGQRMALGTAIYPLETGAAVADLEALVDTGRKIEHRSAALPDPVYFLAVATRPAAGLPARAASQRGCPPAAQRAGGGL